MHTLALLIAQIFAPLTDFSTALAIPFRYLGGGTGPGSFLLAALVVASIALAVGCSLWAILENVRNRRRLARLRATLRRSERAVRFRDALFEAAPQSTLVLRPRSKTTLSFGRGSEIFGHCLAGPDARPLARAMIALLTQGTAFALTARTLGLRNVDVRGAAVGDSSVLFFRDAEPTNKPDIVHHLGDHESDFAPSQSPRIASPEMPTVVRLPVFDTSGDAAIVIGSDGRLKQHNAAFARQWQLSEDDLRGQPLLSELAARAIGKIGCDAIWDVVTAAISSQEPERLGDWGTLSRGDGRAISLRMARLPDGGTSVVFVEGTQSDAGRPWRIEPIRIAA